MKVINQFSVDDQYKKKTKIVLAMEVVELNRRIMQLENKIENDAILSILMSFLLLLAIIMIVIFNWGLGV